MHICCWKFKQGGGLCLGGEGFRDSYNKESSSFAFLLVWYVEFATKKGGMLSFTHLFVRRSLILNPLSAIKWSPFSRRSMRPLSCAIFPDHGFEMKVKAPQGAILTKNQVYYGVCSHSTWLSEHMGMWASQ